MCYIYYLSCFYSMMYHLYIWHIGYLSKNNYYRDTIDKLTSTNPHVMQTFIYRSKDITCKGVFSKRFVGSLLAQTIHDSDKTVATWLWFKLLPLNGFQTKRAEIGTFLEYCEPVLNWNSFNLHQNPGKTHLPNC